MNKRIKQRLCFLPGNPIKCSYLLYERNVGTCFKTITIKIKVRFNKIYIRQFDDKR